MDLEQLKELGDEDLVAAVQALSRSDMDTQFQLLSGQRSVLLQQLESFYTAEREKRFMAIRPGGLEEIDRVIQIARQENQKELTLLAAYRNLNRVALHFMDAYEAHVLGDLKHMPKNELDDLYVKVSEEVSVATKLLQQPSSDFRKSQDTSGKLRLAQLFKDAIRKELVERFEDDPEVS